MENFLGFQSFRFSEFVLNHGCTSTRRPCSLSVRRASPWKHEAVRWGRERTIYGEEDSIGDGEGKGRIRVGKRKNEVPVRPCYQRYHLYHF